MIFGRKNNSFHILLPYLKLKYMIFERKNIHYPIENSLSVHVHSYVYFASNKIALGYMQKCTDTSNFIITARLLAAGIE